MSIPDQTGKTAIALSQMGPFEDLFKKYYPFVCIIVHKYVADKTKVEDITQEIFTELWVKRDQILIHSSVAAYLRRMAVSRTLNFLRDSKKYNWDDLDSQVEMMPVVGYHQPEAILMLDEEELKKKLGNAIEKLPEKCRIVFVMSRYDELSYAEIAENLDISIKTVENQIGKALKYLRMAINENRG